MKSRIFLIIGVIFFIAGSLTGYFLTDYIFRVRKIPYPFQLFGAVFGLAFAFFTLAILQFFRVIFSFLMRSRNVSRIREKP